LNRRATKGEIGADFKTKFTEILSIAVIRRDFQILNSSPQRRRREVNESCEIPTEPGAESLPLDFEPEEEVEVEDEAADALDAAAAEADAAEAAADAAAAAIPASAVPAT
jgi:hypothetical protein